MKCHMTRNIIALSIVFVAILTVFSLTGCKKDNTEVPVKTDTEKVTEVVDDVMKDAAAEDHTGHNHE